MYIFAAAKYRACDTDKILFFTIEHFVSLILRNTLESICLRAKFHFQISWSLSIDIKINLPIISSEIYRIKKERRQ